jgi:hypothetical protein
MRELSHHFRVDEPLLCRIRIQGDIGRVWLMCWRGLKLAHVAAPDGAPESLLTGQLADQAALLGIINYLSDLGHFILSVESQPRDAAPGKLADAGPFTPLE